jgi:hypothetical protein
MKNIFLKANSIFNLKFLSIYNDFGIQIKFHLINNAKQMNIPQFVICPETDCKICFLYEKLNALDKWYSFKDWMKTNFNSNINLKQFEQCYVPVIELTPEKRLMHGIFQLWNSDALQISDFIINNTDENLGKFTDNRIIKILTNDHSQIDTISINPDVFFVPTNQLNIENIKRDFQQYVENDLVFNKQNYQLIIYSLANLTKSFWRQINNA